VSPRSTDQRLEDILDAIQTIGDHQVRGQALGLSPEEPLLLDAVVRQLAVIGEAASHLPAHVTNRHPEIPWRGVKGMRLLLDHEYHRTDSDIVWRTVREELPALGEAVHAELDR
jgi:uncharacterized protein with HEPN domain